MQVYKMRRDAVMNENVATSDDFSVILVPFPMRYNSNYCMDSETFLVNLFQLLTLLSGLLFVPGHRISTRHHRRR
jgi:hypothetical protein